MSSLLVEQSLPAMTPDASHIRPRTTPTTRIGLQWPIARNGRLAPRDAIHLDAGQGRRASPRWRYIPQVSSVLSV